ncbi:MnhB domain-containing protein [Deinococcus sp. Marseille-Q6407]|uniref:MnhB domain-containing protein n=1 Tax=Deinococcus sp. Marseille-Q6407 TaxID=2969223 RepID=UPI0021C1866C|nr:MnhB domain-containing protein [Deinococcus sp. Marseille-Q6407]
MSPKPSGKAKKSRRRKERSVTTTRAPKENVWDTLLSDPDPEEQGGIHSTGYESLASSVVNDPILKTVAQPTFALIAMFTLLLFWRGHQLPGGGFAGGAMMVCALLLHRIATGRSAVDFNFTRLIPTGLAISFMTGLVPYLLHGFFLKSSYGYLYTRLTGEFEWASAMAFDLGVFLLVVGGGMTIAGELIDIDPKEVVEGDR